MMRHTKTIGIVEVDSSVWKRLTPEEIVHICDVCDRKLEEYFSKLEKTGQR